MVINVCVGSACHIKGSYDVIKCLQELIVKENLSEKITLKGSFCLGKCTDSVSVCIEGSEEVLSFSPSNAEEKFYELIKKEF